MGKVSPGQRFKIGAADWNSFIDAANFVKQNSQNINTETTGSKRNENLILIRNQSGSAIKAFQPVALSELAVQPNNTTGAPLVNATICFDGLKATTNNAAKAIAITQEPIAAGKLGKALSAGTTLAFVDIEDTNHRYAVVDLTDGSLKSAVVGSARILWQPPATGPDRLCVIQFPLTVGYEGMFAVVPWGNNVVKVVDGSGFSANAGTAWINGESFTVAPVTFNVGGSSSVYYIYLQATTTKSGDTYTIDTPTLESSTDVPTYEDGKCKILLARVRKNQIVQEWHGQLYGTIYGECE